MKIVTPSSIFDLLILQESGFPPEEFYILTSLTSWATCSAKDIPNEEEEILTASDVKEAHCTTGCESEHDNTTEQETDDILQHQSVEASESETGPTQLMEK